MIEISKAAMRKFVLAAGGVGVTALAVKEAIPIVQIFSDRKAPEITSNIEDIPDLDIGNMVSAHVHRELWPKLSEADRDLYESWEKDKNELLDSYASFVSFFGKMYFLNDPSSNQETGGDYARFIQDVFIPEMLSMDGDVSIGTLFCLAKWSKEIAHENYVGDIRDERVRGVFQHLAMREKDLTGKEGISQVMQRAIYDLPASYDHSDKIGPVTGIRFQTEASVGVNDQDLSLLAEAFPYIYKDMPDKYASVANAALSLRVDMAKIDLERSVIGNDITDFVKRINPNNPIYKTIEQFTQSYSNKGISDDKFWIDIGLGVDLPGGYNKRDIDRQLTKPGWVWSEYTTRVLDKSDTPDEVIKKSFEYARTFMGQNVSEDHFSPNLVVGDIDNYLKNLFFDQMFSEKFRNYVVGTLSGESKIEWENLCSKWQSHEKTVRVKQRHDELLFSQMGEFEYDPHFQALLNKGLSKYYLDCVRSDTHPFLKKAVEDPLVQMAIVASIREICPPIPWVGMRNGPIARFGVNPFNIRAIINLWEDVLHRSQDGLDFITARNVLEDIFQIEGSATLTDLYEQHLGPDQGGTESLNRIAKDLGSRAILMGGYSAGWNAQNLAKGIYIAGRGNIDD